MTSRETSFSFTEAELDEALALIAEISKMANGNPGFGFDDPYDFFIKKMMCLTPQSYGARIQNYIAEKFNLQKVIQAKGKGDWKNSMQQHYEVKVSIITGNNDSLNVVQIRPWQEISGYYLVAIDTRTSPFKSFVFHLSKNEMSIECEKLASSAHGTKSANSNNENVELRFSVKISETDPTFIGWCSKYLQKDIQLR